MKSKKILSVLLAIIILAGTSVSALAAVPTDNTVSPRYIQTQECDAFIQYSGNNATAGAAVTTRDKCTVKVTITIQNYTSAGWTDYTRFHTQTVVTTAGVEKSVSNTAYNIPDGYYKTSAYIEIYKNGVFVESDTVTSAIKYKGI